MKGSLFRALEQWFFSGNSTQGQFGQSPSQLRVILGEILEAANEASLIFKKGSRNPTRETIVAAKEIWAEINSFENVRNLLPHVEDKLLKITRDPKTIGGIINILHSLEQTRFNNQQLQELSNLANQDNIPTSQDFPEETDAEGLDNLLKSSIYNVTTPSGKTLKAIREILQNAVDACDPEQHAEVADPAIKLTTHQYQEADYIDLIIHDNGIGMDWEVLSKNFFVTFSSGKRTDAGAAGGFGIAKALIQGAPKHGWSIDTKSNREFGVRSDPIHSSRFHKNLYFGSRQGAGYAIPTSKIKQDGKGGTILSLYGLPKVSDDTIEELCTVYAANGRVKIVLNNKEVVPKFTLQGLQSLGAENLKNIPDMVGKDDAEKTLAATVFKNFSANLQEKLRGVELGLGEDTHVDFFLRKLENSWASGKLYVMVNGQYQFDRSEWINKMDIICSIRTKARPGTEEYPLDPGRESIRGIVGERVKEVVEAVKRFTAKLGEDELFKQGIDMFMVNKDAAPMTTFDSMDSHTKEHLVQTLNADLSAAMDAPEPEAAVKKFMDAIVKQTEDDMGGVTPIQQAVTAALKQDAQEGLIDLMKRIDHETLKRSDELLARCRTIIDGLTTPANMMIQKSFVARDVLNQNVELSAEMVILWQKTLRILIERLSKHHIHKSAVSRKKFVPGLIFTDECMGICMSARPEVGRPYATVAINPLTLASAVNPKAFTDKLNPHLKKNTWDDDSEAFSALDNDGGSDDEDERGKSSIADTPTNRITNFLFHIGLHELCHLLYPDYPGSHDVFHKNLTHLEIICQGSIDSIRAEVKKHMKGLKSNSNKLLNLIVKEKRKKIKEHVGPIKFNVWMEERRKYTARLR